MNLNQVTMTDDQVTQAWIDAQTALAAAKELEASLRTEVIRRRFADQSVGTKNVELGNGYKLKAVFKQNTSVKTDQVESVLKRIENSGPEGAFIAERLFKFKPELVKREYDELPAKFRKIVDEIVTTSAATPSLEFVKPKSKN